MNAIYLIIALNIFSFNQYDTPHLYELDFESVDGSIINMAAYRNKHLIIVEFNALNPDKNQLSALDSIYQADTAGTVIIGIPALDFDSSIVSESILRSALRDSLHLTFPISSPAYTKARANAEQHVLMQWVTKATHNGHTDNVITDDGQFFLISTTGLLYASLSKPFTYDTTLLNLLINNEPVNTQ